MERPFSPDSGIAATALTRRRLLKSAAGFASAAAAALMPPNVRRVLGQAQARRGSFREIKHVVVLMQDNRSFDHYFGTMAGRSRVQRSGCAQAPRRALRVLPAGL